MKKLFILFFSLATAAFYSQTLSTSLTACYALNSNGTEPINNLTGTLSAVTATVDRFNNPNSALYFNGTASSYVALPDNPLIKPTNAISFSAWIKPTQYPLTTQYILFTKNNAVSNFESYSLNFNLNPGGYQFRVHKGNGGLTDIVDCTTPIVINTWYHVVFTMDNVSLKLYINGVLENTSASTLSFVYTNNKKVFLGVTNEASYEHPFFGIIDNARFYNRILSAAEVNQLFITDPQCITAPPTINCNTSFYAQTASGVFESNLGVLNTSTVTSLPLPPGAGGLTLGPAFGFPAPNPTYWTTSGGTYWYYDGTSFINTFHVMPNIAAVNMGGSKNFIYSMVGATGQVYKYNGTSTSTLVASIPAIAASGPYDIIGDDQDNFYYLRTLTPQSLNVYDPTGILTCSYNITGATISASGGGFAIVGNTVTAYNGTYHVGTISGSNVNFTTTTASFPSPADFANCYIDRSFASTITANPSATLTCASSSSIALVATSTLSPVTYSWSGPGIVTANNNTVFVNVPGVYTCSLNTTTGCPTRLSISTFTVYSGNITPTISATNSLSCTAPTATLAVLPNLVPHVFFWSGPGISSSLTSSSITINAGSIYSVTVTNPVTGCSATQTINILNSIATLTINAVATATSLCSPSAPITMTASGAINYTWTPAGSTLPGTGSVVAANPTVTTTYSVNGASGVCTGSTAITILVIPQATLITSGNTTLCAGSQTTLSVTGGSIYTWFPGNVPGPTISISPTTTTTYTVFSNNSSCVTSATVSVLVLPSPTITTSASPTIICQGSTATLTAGGALSYTWQPVNVSGTSVTVSPLTTTIYTVTGPNILGCTSNATVQLVVNNPTIIVSPLSGSLCAGQSATLSASGATGYTWNPGGANTSSIIVTPSINTIYTLTTINGVCASTNTIPIAVSPNPTLVLASTNSTICSGNSTTLSVIGAATYTWMPGTLNGSAIVVSPTNNTNYTVTGTNSFACTSSLISTVIVNPTPTITATGSPTTICSGVPALLTASGGVTYTWSPVSSNSSTIVVTPSVTTTYSVAASNSFNCVSSQTISIFVIPTPTITISASPTIICNGSSSTLIASGAASFSWMPGSLTGTSVVVSPTSTTVYTVSGANGVCNSTRTFTLIVLAKPTIDINTLPTAICNGGTSLLLGTGATGYTWTPSNANSNTLVVTPSVTTTYTLTGINTAGCINTATTTVTVNPTPTVTINSSTNTVCSGNSATLTLNGAVNYLSLPGAQTGSVIVVSPTVNTTYTITGLNSFACPDTETITITIAPGPTITATSSATLLCDGGTFSLSANGAANYTWMPVNITGATIATTATNSINTYTVFGETGGCKNTATVLVVVISCNNTMFGMTKAAGKPVLVYNTYYNVTFTVTAVNASTINLTNVSMDEDLAAAFPSPSNFSVVSQPIITSQNSGLFINPLFDGVSQISLTSPTTSTLLANKRDTIVFTIRVDPRGYFGPFKNSVIGFAQFINNAIVSDSSNNGFIWDPDQDGDPTNNDTATVINFSPIDLFIPDGFSPNGDGINDVFFVKGMNARPVKLIIFNRWGNKVYEKADYDNSWNAYPNTANTMGSDKVPQGTYYYVIEFLDGDKETRTGFVVIQY
jgi:gliding motility-associated-like protein